MERSGKQLVSVPYRGAVVSFDPKKGLRVKLDGVRREWVTDDDEWDWLPADDQAPLPHRRPIAAHELAAEAVVVGLVGGARRAAVGAVNKSRRGGRVRRRARRLPTSAPDPEAARCSTNTGGRGDGAEGGPTAARARASGEQRARGEWRRDDARRRPLRRRSAAAASAPTPRRARPTSRPRRRPRRRPPRRQQRRGGRRGRRQPPVKSTAGPHAGKEAKVLHVGNGASRAAAADGGVATARRGDGRRRRRRRTPAARAA